jgi:hypothetical protein
MQSRSAKRVRTDGPSPPNRHCCVVLSATRTRRPKHSGADGRGVGSGLALRGCVVDVNMRGLSAGRKWPAPSHHDFTQGLVKALLFSFEEKSGAQRRSLDVSRSEVDHPKQATPVCGQAQPTVVQGSPANLPRAFGREGSRRRILAVAMTPNPKIQGPKRRRNPQPRVCDLPLSEPPAIQHRSGTWEEGAASRANPRLHSGAAVPFGIVRLTTLRGTLPRTTVRGAPVTHGPEQLVDTARGFQKLKAATRRVLAVPEKELDRRESA